MPCRRHCIWCNTQNLFDGVGIVVSVGLQGYGSKCSLIHFHWSVSAYDAVTTVIKSKFGTDKEDNSGWILGSRKIKNVSVLCHWSTGSLHWYTYKQPQLKIELADQGIRV